jgi:hypothetical protein
VGVQQEKIRLQGLYRFHEGRAALGNLTDHVELPTLAGKEQGNRVTDYVMILSKENAN